MLRSARGGVMGKDPAKAHGVNGYTNLGCRCEVCRAAWATYHLQYGRRYQQAHPERIKAANDRYRRANLDKVRAAGQRRAAERRLARESDPAYIALQAERAAKRASQVTCPKCGGVKLRQSTICLDCWNARGSKWTPEQRRERYREYMRKYMARYRNGATEARSLRQDLAGVTAQRDALLAALSPTDQLRVLAGVGSSSC